MNFGEYYVQDTYSGAFLAFSAHTLTRDTENVRKRMFFTAQKVLSLG